MFKNKIISNIFFIFFFSNNLFANVIDKDVQETQEKKSKLRLLKKNAKKLIVGTVFILTTVFLSLKIYQATLEIKNIKIDRSQNSQVTYEIILAFPSQKKVSEIFRPGDSGHNYWKEILKKPIDPNNQKALADIENATIIITSPEGFGKGSVLRNTHKPSFFGNLSWSGYFVNRFS